MAVIGDTLPHCTGTGTESDPYIFESEQGFLEAIAVPNAYAEAGVSAMTWDCNNGIITSPIVMYCDSLICKGLTIKNCLIQNVDSAIFHIKDKNGGGTNYTNKTINGLNLYNFCIINSGIAFKLITTEGANYAGMEGFSQINFKHCNFAGICIGNGAISQSYQTPMIGPTYNDTQGKTAEFYFNSCTFNIHFKDPANRNCDVNVFGVNYSFQPVTQYNNCTLCISCTNPNASFTIVNNRGTYLNNVTFVNDPLNPLLCKSYSSVAAIYSTLSGYNYHKMNVQASQGCTVNDTYGLINSDKYICTDATYGNTFTGIVMQEHDPTASDYIYSDANLENAGFLVGQVIT